MVVGFAGGTADQAELKERETRLAIQADAVEAKRHLPVTYMPLAAMVSSRRK